MDLVEDGVKEAATFRYLVHILLRCLAFRSATGQLSSSCARLASYLQPGPFRI